LVTKEYKAIYKFIETSRKKGIGYDKIVQGLTAQGKNPALFNDAIYESYLVDYIRLAKKKGFKLSTIEKGLNKYVAEGKLKKDVVKRAVGKFKKTLEFALIGSAIAVLLLLLVLAGPSLWSADDCVDDDGDGFGVTNLDLCVYPDFDCDDDTFGVNPYGIEECDGIDNNCNDLIDEGCDIATVTEERALGEAEEVLEEEEETSSAEETTSSGGGSSGGGGGSSGGSSDSGSSSAATTTDETLTIDVGMCECEEGFHCNDNYECIVTVCNDELDNDGDLLIDFGDIDTNDDGCESLDDSSEEEGCVCEDGSDCVDSLCVDQRTATDVVLCPEGMSITEGGCEEVEFTCKEGYEITSEGNCKEISTGEITCPEGYELNANGDCELIQITTEGDIPDEEPQEIDEETFCTDFLPRCADGVDNDGDGMIDYGTASTNDIGCDDSKDNSELNPGETPVEEEVVCVGILPRCSDGVDNDGDELVDSADPGCEGGRDNTEYNEIVPEEEEEDSICLDLLPRCVDGVDNDNDGFVDGSDEGCDDENYNSELNDIEIPVDETDDSMCLDLLPRCVDGVDNDGDGFIDGRDTGCDSTNPARDNSESS